MMKTKVLSVTLSIVLLLSSTANAGGGWSSGTLSRVRGALTSLQQHLGQKFMVGATALTLTCGGLSCTLVDKDTASMDKADSVNGMQIQVNERADLVNLINSDDVEVIVLSTGEDGGDLVVLLADKTGMSTIEREKILAQVWNIFADDAMKIDRLSPAEVLVSNGDKRLLGGLLHTGALTPDQELVNLLLMGGTILTGTLALFSIHYGMEKLRGKNEISMKRLLLMGGATVSSPVVTYVLVRIVS